MLEQLLAGEAVGVGVVVSSPVSCGAVLGSGSADCKPGGVEAFSLRVAQRTVMPSTRGFET